MIYGVDIQGIIADTFKGKLKPAVLKRHTVGYYDPVDDIEYAAKDETFSTDGIVSQFSEEWIAAGLATRKDRKILLIAKPLGTKPQNGDKVTIEGNTYTVTELLRRDPDTATYILKAGA